MSACSHSHDAVSANARQDPTETTTLRKEYAGKASKRYRRVKGQLRRVVTADGDPLGFAGNVPDRYSFPTNPGEKAEAFHEWVDAALRDEVLERPNGARWTDKYVRSGYGSGLDHADAALKAQGVAVDPVDLRDVFNMPVHRNTLEMLYTRQFEALKGINQAVGTEISRVFTEAFAEGVNPRVAARRLNDRVDKIGITRARTMARTEIVRTHNWAALDRYESVMGGDAKVTVVAEWTTAGDDRVCSRCAALEGARFKLKEARTMIPAHPRCRCTVVPIVDEDATARTLAAWGASDEALARVVA